MADLVGSALDRSTAHREPVDPDLAPWLSAFSGTAAALVLLGGLLVLAGWALDAPLLKSVGPGLATMKANTALAFVLAGAALWLVHPVEPARPARTSAIALSIVVAGIGSLTLGENLFGWNLRIDQLLFEDPATPASAAPGRMSPMTALNFLLLGTATMPLALRPLRFVRFSQGLALAALALSTIALIGYAYGVQSLYRVAPYTSVALHTALAFVGLSAGVLAASARRGWMALVVSRGAGGVLIRQVLLPGIGVLLVFGWLRLEGEKAGYYDTAFGLSVMVVLTGAVLAALVWRSARLLERADRALQENRKQLLDILDNMFPFVGLFSTDGNVLEANRAPLAAAGLKREDVLGKPFAETYWWNYSVEVQERLRAALRRAAGGEVVRYDEVVRMANDQRVTVDVMFSPLRDAQGNVFRIIGSGVDVSARSQAEDELRSLAGRLRELTRRVIETEESERRKINRELHDRVGQSLSTLKLSLEIIGSRLSKKSLAAVGPRLEDAQKLLQAAVRDTRDVMADLRPPALDDFGLLAALRSYAELFSERAGLSVAVDGEEAQALLPAVTETALFRIAQEALANVAKHARAKRVDITLAANGRRVVLTVADNGVGFDVEAASGRASWGMKTMLERAEAVGASLHVESAPGRGTRVVVEATPKPA